MINKKITMYNENNIKIIKYIVKINNKLKNTFKK